MLLSGVNRGKQAKEGVWAGETGAPPLLPVWSLLADAFRRLPAVRTALLSYGIAHGLGHAALVKHIAYEQ